MKNTKAQGISMNVIIIAAIALLVLVILAIIFMGRMGPWGGEVADCVNKGGTCKPMCDSTLNEREMPTWRCSKADRDIGNDKCCFVID